MFRYLFSFIRPNIAKTGERKNKAIFTLKLVNQYEKYNEYLFFPFKKLNNLDPYQL